MTVALIDMLTAFVSVPQMNSLLKCQVTHDLITIWLQMPQAQRTAELCSYSRPFNNVQINLKSDCSVRVYYLYNSECT